jgi:hypothetical protein
MLWLAMGLEFAVTAVVVLNIVLAVVWAWKYKGDRVTENVQGLGLVRPAAHYRTSAEHTQ